MQIQVLDREGKPVPDAVVVIYPGSTTGSPPSLLVPNAVVEQEKMRFVPAVTVVPAGATVRFTNQDRWDHHVRGNPTGAAATVVPSAAPGPAAPAPAAAHAAHPASAATSAEPGAGGNFELRLAGKADGKPANFADVKLSAAGVVLLGCHLHGSMRGHVFVTDSAWTLKTDDNGIARFPSVPDGSAQVRVWHAEQLVDLPRKALQVAPTPVLDTVRLSVVPRVRRAPLAPASPTSPTSPSTPGGPMGSYSLAPAFGGGHQVH